MHHIDADYTYREKKTWRQLQMNVGDNIRQNSSCTATNHQPPITKTIQIRWTRNVGHCSKIKDKLFTVYSGGPLHMDERDLDDQLELIYNGFVLIQDVAWKTCRERSTTETGGDRGSGKCVQAACDDDDDDENSKINLMDSFPLLGN